MANNKFHNKYTKKYGAYVYQLMLPLDFVVNISDDDPVRLLSRILNQLNYDELNLATPIKEESQQSQMKDEDRKLQRKQQQNQYTNN